MSLDPHRRWRRRLLLAPTTLTLLLFMLLQLSAQPGAFHRLQEADHVA